MNHHALAAGQLLPQGAFELDWHADGCHPAGADDARIDGWVKLTVFREDWGFSAIVEPSGLRVASGGYEHALVQRRGAALSRCAQASQRLVQVSIHDAEPAPC